jgi:predicted regulator of Ras-like GTPase activity (Roadblock/LC7/MglB family)
LNRRMMCPSTSRSVFEEVLGKLLSESKALTSMFITKQGTVVADAGETSSLNSTAMAALVAGMFSATREVARLVGENQFSILLQQGERRHIHISLVSEEMMLVIVFEDHNRIGIVRHAARKAAEQLETLLPGNREAGGDDAEISLPQFKEYALNLIDRIFQP